MTTPDAGAAGDSGPVPVACTLASPGLAAQAARWQRLAARAMIERAETGDGLRLSFRVGPGVEEELRALVAVENECCSWAHWTLRAAPGQVVLDVRSEADGIAALRGMFASLPPAPPAGSNWAPAGVRPAPGARPTAETRSAGRGAGTGPGRRWRRS